MSKSIRFLVSATAILGITAIAALAMGVPGGSGVSGVPSEQASKTLWKGTIATENGVKVIKNPSEPIYGEFVFALEEDLRIGGDPTDEARYFPKGGILSIDDEGFLYVADFGNRRVQVYDRTGKFVRTLGRQGQGPGEYGFPGEVVFDSEGNPCVRDSRSLIVYGRDGIFKKRISFKTSLTRYALGPKGTIIGTTQPGLGPGGPKYTLVQLDPEGAPLRTIAEERGEFSENQKSMTLHSYGNLMAYLPLDAETFAHGFSDRYRIHIADAEGRSILIADKDEKPQTISGREKEEIIKSGVYMMIGSPEEKGSATKFPDHRPFFGRFFSDGAGRLYVVKPGSILDKTPAREIDVFSKDGYYLYRMTWPFVPAAIKAGFLYEVRQDKETGETFVIRHRIENWDAMKTGIR